MKFVLHYIVIGFLFVNINAMNTFGEIPTRLDFLNVFIKSGDQNNDKNLKHDLLHVISNKAYWLFTKNRSILNGTHNETYCANQDIGGRNLFFVFLLSCILVIGTLGNCSAIAVIVLSRNLRKQQTNLFIISLAFTDLGALLFVTSLRIDIHRRNQNFCFNLAACKVFNITDVIFHIGSVSHLFGIAIERFIAINKPFFHRAYMTSSVTLACVFGVWTYSFAWSMAGLVRWDSQGRDIISVMRCGGHQICLFDNKNFFTSVYLVIYLIPLFVMGYLYAYILRIARKQSRSIAKLERAQTQTDTGVISVRKRKREFKATKTLVIVYGAFLICWLPLTIIVLTLNWCNGCIGILPEVAIEFIISLFRDSLPPLNSCLNPFIYIIFNNMFRKAFKKLIFGGRGRNLNSVQSSSYMGERIKAFRFTKNNNNGRPSLEGIYQTDMGVVNDSPSTTTTSGVQNMT